MMWDVATNYTEIAASRDGGTTNEGLKEISALVIADLTLYPLRRNGKTACKHHHVA